MFYIIIIFSSIILLLILIYLVGLLLPKKRVLTKKIVFDVPIEKVYNTVINNTDWKYRTGIDDLKIIETIDDFETWEEISSGYAISFKTTKKIPYTFYSFEMTSKLFKGSWNAEFEKLENQKTLFSATENIEYKNPFVKTLSYIFMNLDKYMETYQKDLLKKLKQ